jgi:hypothetical protein
LGEKINPDKPHLMHEKRRLTHEKYWNYEFKNESAKFHFRMSPQKWINETNAIGMISKSEIINYKKVR